MSLSAAIFLLGFFAGCAAAFIRHPVYGLVTYIAVFYIHPPSRWWGQGFLHDIRWALIAAGITLIALLVQRNKIQTAPVFKNGAFWGFVVFVAWIAMQSFWAMDSDAHAELLQMYLKFIVVMYIFCKAVDSQENLKIVLWTHVFGCVYLGWVAFTSYRGGRFEDFGGPGLSEANAGALQLVTGILIAGTLFLASNARARLTLLAAIPLVVNAMVATISRSGFLSAAAGGLVYNLYTPPKHRLSVRILSVLAVVLFALLTNPMYWARMSTMKYKGEDVEGIDTGGGRLDIVFAQWRMFKAHPFGCGHMCTTVLSPSYLDASHLSEGARASHNSIMTMLVDHGVVGGIFYAAMLFWVLRNLREIARRVRGDSEFLGTVLPGIAAALGAIFIGDLFVQYPKFEARVWFISLVIVMLHLTAPERYVNIKASGVRAGS